jgi:hypothetical protein
MLFGHARREQMRTPPKSHINQLISVTYVFAKNLRTPREHLRTRRREPPKCSPVFAGSFANTYRELAKGLRESVRSVRRGAAWQSSFSEKKRRNVGLAARIHCRGVSLTWGALPGTLDGKCAPAEAGRGVCGAEARVLCLGGGLAGSWVSMREWRAYVRVVWTRTGEKWLQQ